VGYSDAPPGWWQEQEFGRRNAVPPEMLIRVTPTKIVAKVNISE
jgi:hypothetical protein